MNTIPLLLTAALLTGLSAQSELPQDVPSGVTAGRQLPTRVLFDRPDADGPLWAVGHTWKASFDGSGCTVIPFFGSQAPQDFPLRLELAQATVGGAPLQLVAGEPVLTGTAVRTGRGAVTEVVDTSLESLEQSFVFEALPNRGAIVVDVRMRGPFATTGIAGGLRFANEFGHVDYTKAVAVDAAGRRLPLDITWTGESARMAIPASFVEQAQLPIVLDPVLNYWYWLGNPSQTQHDGDVAVIQVPGIGGRTLLVWQRNFSASDTDCWGLMFDNVLGLVQTDFIIDASTIDWTKVAVAGNNYAQNFLVVAEVRVPSGLGSQYYIAGRTVATNAAVGNVFDIERAGVIGFAGDNFAPDVGSDPYYGVGRYTVVFQKNSGGAADIYMKQVTPAGGLVTTSPIALATTANAETRPQISKSCGQSNGLPAYWLVTWQYTYSGSDEDVFGRFVNWNGALPGGLFGISTGSGYETAPSPSSPIDQNGVRYWPVAFEYATSNGQPRDVWVRLVRADGTSPMSGFIASDGVPNADDFAPDADADGMRFVVTMSKGQNGNAHEVQAATFAYLPTVNSWRLEGRSGLITSSLDDYGQTAICAEFSGGNAPTPNYALCFTEFASNTLRLERWGGYVDSTFFSPRATACGTLGISASGSPVLGQTVTITVANGGLSGTVGGFPTYVPLLGVLGCNCVLGVDFIGFFGNPFLYTIPNDPMMVGTTFSVQGYTVVGSSCLGSLDFSDTIDFTVR